MHRGCQLRDDALLSGLDVDGATITCLLRVLGGNPYGRIPLYWWFGFSRSYQDGRAGEEGRICHVLSEIEFSGDYPVNWYSDGPLSSWQGITLHSGIIDCPHVVRWQMWISDFESISPSCQESSRFVSYVGLSS